jgi:hypothetical protein
MSGKYDAGIAIFISSYKVESSLFLVLATILFAVSVVILSFKIIGFILRIPFLLGSKLVSYKKSNEVRKLMETYFYLLSNQKNKASKTLSKLSKNSFVFDVYKDHASFLKSVTEGSGSTRHLDDLNGNNDLKLHLFKNIVKEIYLGGSSKDAMRLIESTKMDDNKDPDYVFLKARIYATQNRWDIFTDFIKKYVDLNKDMDDEARSHIAEVYKKGAKYFSRKSQGSLQLDFLKQALLYNPKSLEALELFYNLSNSLGHMDKCLKVLESAFAANPSLEIFELYNQSANMKPEGLYDKFAGLADPHKYRHVFLSIAACLKLQDKIDLILSQKK